MKILLAVLLIWFSALPLYAQTDFSEENAAQHDEELVILTDEFAKYVTETRNTKRPTDATLH